MPSFTFTDTEGRIYPELALTVAPGDVVELDENPDPERFSDTAPAKSKKAAASSDGETP